MKHFTADTHFGHANIIRHCLRPFATVEEHDAVLVANWNDRVARGDLVYHLGDFSMHSRAPEELLAALKGQIILVKGNHDRAWVDNHPRFSKVVKLEEIVLSGHKVVLCHYAMRTWPQSHRGSWHLYGHSHGKMPPYGRSMDVGVDAQGFRPVSEGEVAVFMDGRGLAMKDGTVLKQEAP